MIPPSSSQTQVKVVGVDFSQEAGRQKKFIKDESTG